MSDIIDHVAMCDDLSRRSAIRLRQPITIILDADQGVISQRNIAAIDDPTAVHVLYRFPGHFKMRQFVIHGGYSMAGSTEISISASGLSASYAIELTDARLTEWLIVSGLTGQTVRTENEQHVFETLGETSRPGDDAR
ncbi:MAG TPA: hypothetical protein VG326_00125 [Tepidisphaeraceae bacterium]|nr:hypothetical protein [Tepidisphaeraceae bacterium]